MRADCLPFANVSVRVNGKDLIEYQTEGASDDDPMVATTYIEAVEGAIFDVCVNLEPGFAYAKNHLSNEMSLDGAWVAGKITALSPLWRTTIMDGVTELTAEGTATFRCFKFAAHQTTDAKPGSFSQRDKLSSLGEIKVQLLRCRRTRTSYNPVKNDFKGVIKDGIPEKALKGRAVSCHAELGEAQSIAKRGFSECDFPYGKKPLAVYKFFYRSHRDLQIEGIIERTPSPVPLEDRDFGQLTQQELGELARRGREALLRERVKNDNSVTIKQECQHEKRSHATGPGGAGDEGDVTITSEAGAKKRAKPITGQVIELD